MVGNVSAGSVEPVVCPGIREGKRQRLIRVTREQIAGRTGPARQVRRRDEVVSPLALEQGCLQLLQRAQRAISVVLRSEVWAHDLRGAVGEAVLRQHEWEIAVSLREITELLLDMVSSAGGGTAGPMTASVLVAQNRAVSLARDATTARVLALELLAAHLAAADAARRDWEAAHRAAAKNDKYLDLVARTAADQHATTEITGIAGRAAEASQALRETLQQAALAAEALALPLPGQAQRAPGPVALGGDSAALLAYQGRVAGGLTALLGLRGWRHHLQLGPGRPVTAQHADEHIGHGGQGSSRAVGSAPGHEAVRPHQHRPVRGDPVRPGEGAIRVGELQARADQVSVDPDAQQPRRGARRVLPGGPGGAGQQHEVTPEQVKR